MAHPKPHTAVAVAKRQLRFGNRISSPKKWLSGGNYPSISVLYA